MLEEVAGKEKLFPLGRMATKAVFIGSSPFCHSEIAKVLLLLFLFVFFSPSLIQKKHFSKCILMFREKYLNDPEVLNQKGGQKSQTETKLNNENS